MSNYKFAGAGTVPAGEYDDVSVSGSAKGYGNIICKNFHASGSFGGNCSITCSDKLKASGAFKAGGSIKAACVSAAGSFSCGGNLEGEKIKIAGSVNVENGISGDDVRINGSIECGGLINAENFVFEHDGFSKIGSIGGSSISIKRGGSSAGGFILKLLKKANEGMLTVSEEIEGDLIEIDHVKTPQVVGRIVKIGSGCKIGRVVYSESIEIAPDAQVEICEKA